MASTFRIAVLSDQHIDSVIAPGSWELAKVAFAAAVAERPDHVVLAGDTFDCATAMLRDRDLVERELRRHGLWERDRLTILPGNHDLFHTPHRGERLTKLRELARNGLKRSASNFAAFSEWVRPLTRREDRLDAIDVFPLRKEFDGDVVLYAMDTTSRETRFSSNGFWHPEHDRLVRNATSEAHERRVLAMHHAPLTGRLCELSDLAQGHAPLRFAPPHYDRVVAFADDAKIDAIVAGHLHVAEDYTWRVGEGTLACLVGRTGAVHKTTPVVGVLDVPLRTRVRWSEVEL